MSHRRSSSTYVRPDHTFRLTKWRVVNFIFIVFLVLIAWQPLWEKMASLCKAVGSIFSSAK